MHPPLERGLHDGPGLAGLHAAVVDAVRHHDEVACKPVAADVGRLPDPFVLDLLAYGVVERPAELRAAAVVLAVRADEEERVVDRPPGRSEIDAEEVVVALELHAAKLRLGGVRTGDVREEAVAPPAIGST